MTFDDTLCYRKSKSRTVADSSCGVFRYEWLENIHA